MKRIEWTAAMLRELRRRVPVEGASAALARDLGVSASAVWNKALDLGVPTCGRGVAVRWTAAMLRDLRGLYASVPNAELCRRLGVSMSTLHRKARELGLRKRGDFRELIGISARIAAGQRASPNMEANIAARFKPGVRSNPAGEFRRGEPRTEAFKAAQSERLRREWAADRTRAYLGLPTKRHLCQVPSDGRLVDAAWIRRMEEALAVK